MSRYPAKHSKCRMSWGRGGGAVCRGTQFTPAASGRPTQDSTENLADRTVEGVGGRGRKFGRHSRGNFWLRMRSSKACRHGSSAQVRLQKPRIPQAGCHQEAGRCAPGEVTGRAGPLSGIMNSWLLLHPFIILESLSQSPTFY